ncbi:Na+/H+ antiporter NhaC family protein [Luedemannella flava]
MLTAQLVGVDVHAHIKRQAWTSIPAFIIAFVVFLILSLTGAPDVHNPVGEEIELQSLDGIYRITAWNLLPLVLLAFLSIRKVPATLALMASALFAGVLGAFLQADVMRGSSAATRTPWSARSRASGWPWPTASRSARGSPRSTSCCRGAAWTACC